MLRFLLAVLLLSLATCGGNFKCRSKRIVISELTKTMDLPPKDDVELYNGGKKKVTLKEYYLVFFPRPTLNHDNGVPITDPKNVYSLNKCKIPAKGFATLTSVINKPDLVVNGNGFAVALYKKTPKSKNAFTNKNKPFRADVKACLVDLVYYGNAENNHQADVTMFNNYAQGLQRQVVPLTFVTSVSRSHFNIQKPFGFLISKTPSMGSKNQDLWLELRAWATGNLGMKCDQNPWESITNKVHEEYTRWHYISNHLLPASCQNVYISIEYDPAIISFPERALTATLTNGVHTNSDTKCDVFDSWENVDVTQSHLWSDNHVVDNFDLDSVSGVLAEGYELAQDPKFVRFDVEEPIMVCRITL